jgi:serine phosphatase RsbU (regulator of sigma subunit)
MSAPLRAAVVRIHGAGHSVTGVGFLVAARKVLTCAHVVIQALGQPAESVTELAGMRVRLDFPLLEGPRKPLFAVVDAELRTTPGSDIAGLSLTEDPPAGATPAPLVLADDLWNHPIRVFGFPENADEGEWASGRLLETQGSGWLQLEDVKQTGRRVRPGYSGGPIWDDDLHAVAGMVVAADAGPGDKVAFAIPVRMLVEAWPTVLGDVAKLASPYHGLRSFRERDAKEFFGRERFVDHLVETIGRQTMAPIVAASGSGKTSVISAGLFPRLHREGEWTLLRFRPGRNPFRSLAAAFVPILAPELNEIDRLQRVGTLAKLLQEPDRLLELVEGIVQDAHERRILIVADQFEELFALDDAELRNRFLDRLVEATMASSRQREPPLTTLIALRADFYASALAHHGLYEALLANPPLAFGAMSRDELRRAIEDPAAAKGVRVDPRIVEDLVAAVGAEPGKLPLLEFALTRLWETREGLELTFSAYEALGRVEGALARYADDVYAQLPEPQQERAEHVFLQLVRPGEGTEDSRRLAAQSDFSPESWEIVQRLAGDRLVITDRSEAIGQQTAELVHEALIRTWARLRGWIDEDRQFRTWQEQMRAAIGRWRNAEHDRGALLRGQLLAEAEAWVKERLDDVGAEELEFVTASLDQREQELNERIEHELTVSQLGQAEDTVRRLRSLVDLSTAMVMQESLEDLLTLVGLQASRLIDADAIYLLRVGPDKRSLTVAASHGPGTEEAAGLRIELDDWPGAARVLTAGGMIASGQEPGDGLGREPLEPAPAPIGRPGVQSQALALIGTTGHPLGLLCAHRAGEPNGFSEKELVFVQTLMSSVNAAAEQLRLMQTLQDTVEELQAVALPIPASLPAIPGLDIGAGYRSPPEVSQVGADFYDVFQLEDGRVVVTMGDMSGKGISNAIRATRVRYALRLVAEQDPTPGVALSRFNNLLFEEFDPEQYASVLILLFDPASGVASWSSAAHPPPAVIGPVASRILDYEGSLPVGWFRDVPYPTDSFALEPESSVVLHTDGLTKHAAHHPEGAVQAELVDTLSAAVQGGARTPTSMEIVERLLQGVAVDDHGTVEDDVVVAVLRRS